MCTLQPQPLISKVKPGSLLHLSHPAPRLQRSHTCMTEEPVGNNKNGAVKTKEELLVPSAREPNI